MIFRKNKYPQIRVSSFLDKIPIIKDWKRNNEVDFIPENKKERKIEISEKFEIPKKIQEPQEIKPKENITIRIDSNKGIFRKKDLTEHEIGYLKHKDFIELSAVGVASKKQDLYFILPRSNESPIHFFLCKVIEEFILGFTSDVRLYETKKPDVVFGAGGQKFAVEVETGTRPSRNPVGFEEKVRELNKRFGERWFFVVTDRKLRKEYERRGRTFVRGEVAGQIRAIFETAKKPKEKGQDSQIQPKNE